MNCKSVNNSPRFLLDYTVTYEVILSNNGKYICWKLLFPRVGDSLFTVDKLMDLSVWKELYCVLTRISVEYDASAPIVSEMLDKNRYKLSFKKIAMSPAHIRDVFNVNVKEIFAVVQLHVLLTNNNDGHVPVPLTADKNSVGVNLHTKTMTTGNAPKLLNGKRAYAESESSSESDVPTSAKSLPSKRMKVHKPSAHPENIEVSTSSESSSESESESETESESSSESESESETESESDSSLSDSSCEQSNNKLTSYEDVDIPSNLKELGKLMKNTKYLTRFGYATFDKEKYRHFDHVDDKMRYAAFRCSKMMEIFGDTTKYTLFFYFSQELLEQFRSFSEVKFTGVNHVLMVFKSEDDGVRPFAFFLLRDNKESLRHIPKVINEWINEKHSTNVTKCIMPFNSTLQRSVAKVWPKARLIGCSAEYHSKIKDFAEENRGLGAERKTELTRLACSLCFLDEKYFPVGIDVISKHSKSVYGTNLVNYLRSKWLSKLKSVKNERNIHRSLNVCAQFSKQVKRNHFLSKCPHTMGRQQVRHKHVWEFIDFLRRLGRMSTLEMQYGVKSMFSRTFMISYNTDLQKEKEVRCQSAWKELDESRNTMSDFDAVEQFMLKISPNM